ncbi:hypothetical protein J14TS5_22400 [Paenibacillus lautus]|nr:hypothetical protein J14TS5_22400 [Paenibacillus lautus]
MKVECEKFYFYEKSVSIFVISNDKCLEIYGYSERDMNKRLETGDLQVSQM